MTQHLSEEFWSERYTKNETGWDLGAVSPPIKAYFDKVLDKNLKILIPGCGNGYEAEYLHNLGFKHVHIIDLSEKPLEAIKQRVPDFPVDHIHKGDFMEHQGLYDIIVEQTCYCAIDPSLRSKYAESAYRLLKPNGILVGLLFNHETESGPPYGGSREEYTLCFQPYFKKINITDCLNSVKPRMGREYFIELKKD